MEDAHKGPELGALTLVSGWSALNKQVFEHGEGCKGEIMSKALMNCICYRAEFISL